MADVFVSYSRNDKARVSPLVAAIKAKGWSVWWDPSIAAGQQFDDQIEAELQAASAVLVAETGQHPSGLPAGTSLAPRPCPRTICTDARESAFPARVGGNLKQLLLG